MPSSMEHAICLGSASPQGQTTILCTNLACQACKNGIGKEMYDMVGSFNKKERKEISRICSTACNQYSPLSI